MLLLGVFGYLSAVHQLEDLAGQEVLGDSLCGVREMGCHCFGNGVEGEEGEEVEVAVDFRVGGAKEELSDGHD